MKSSHIWGPTAPQKIFTLLARPTVLCVAVLLMPLGARAALSGLGDNSELIEALGYGIAGQPGMTGDLIVGRTDVGGIFIDVAFDPGPLISPSGVVGRDEGSYGALSLDGFPSDWLIGDTGTAVDSAVDLIVGNAGTGVIDLFDSAKVQVGDNSYSPPPTFPSSSPPSAVVAGTGVTVLGREAAGNGQVTLTSLGSRLVTATLIVADLGVGDIVVSSRAALYTADAIIGNDDGSIGTVTLSDLGTRWTVGDSTTPSTLTIGNGDPAATNAHGNLNINTGALVQTTDVVTVNETGQINLAGGTLRDIDIGSATPISNSGLIRGDGFIEATLEITGSGELRNAAATANQREYLLFSGTVTNMGGYIESFGGEMEFLDIVTNAIGGEMVARDAIIRVVSGGLVNDGDLILGGDTIVHGAISGAGILTVLSNSMVTVVGDITFTESLLVAAINEGQVAAFLEPPSSNAINITVGNTPGTLDVIGDVTFGSSTVLDLDYSSNVSSQPGDSFQVVTAGNILGTFANDRVVTDGRYWDISYVGDEVFVTASADLFSPTSGDFNGDGVVSGLDFLSWQRGFGSGYNAGDLANWEAGYGGAPPVAAAAAVPEPSALLLALSALAFATRRRVT